MNSKPEPCVLITGGSRGIGAATALLAARRGYNVCFSYHSNEHAATGVRRAIEALGRQAFAVQADLGCEADIVQLFENAVRVLGGITAFVNNAGILRRQSKITEFSAERVERIFQVNAIGKILAAREAVRHMAVSRGGQGGVIVNVSSVAAKTGSPNEYIDYAASKGAIDTLTVGLSREVADDGIRVCGVRPGMTHTEIHASGGEPNRVARLADRIPMKRGGEPEEIAESILWLLSDSASYVTGSVLDVTGGL